MVQQDSGIWIEPEFGEDWAERGGGKDSWSLRSRSEVSIMLRGANVRCADGKWDSIEEQMHSHWWR